MKIFFGLVALILLLIAVVQMFNDNWGPGVLFFGLGIVAIFLIPQDGPRSGGSIHWFE